MMYSKIGILIFITLWLNAWGKAEIRVACVGNSVTFGYGLVNRTADCYPAKLQGLLGEGYWVANFGVSGTTVLQKGHRPYLNTEEYRKALDFTPDILVVELGLNDTDPRDWPNFGDDFIADFQRLIHAFKRRDGNSPRVFICRMPPIFSGHPRFKSGTRDWFWQIQHSIEQVAANTGAVLIDLHSVFYGHPELFPDNLHPNEQGAEVLSHTIYSSITGNFGGFKLAPVFSENMVFQQKRPFRLYGTANSNDHIQVSFHSSRSETVAGFDGKWNIVLSPVGAGGPYTLQIRVNGKLVTDWNNILVGEVWFCSGQSNMDFRLKWSKDAASAIAWSDDSDLRLLKYSGLVQTDDVQFEPATLNKINDLDFFHGSWQACTPEASSEFSAVAYYFGKQLRSSLKVPVGLIQLSVGGAPTEAFIDRKTLEFDPVLVNEFTNWETNDFIFDWVRQRAVRNMGQNKMPAQRHPYHPAYIFEAGLAPLGNFPLKGIIWYQGESNAHNYSIHELAFKALVNSWRNFWKNPEMPFLFAQLSGINRPSWPAFRDSQRRLADSIGNTAMVVTSDLGDSLNVHPARKMEVGQRFAWQALQKVYGYPVMADGPKPSEIKVRRNKVFIKFLNGKIKTSDGKPLRELEVQRKDGLFYLVEGCLKRNKVKINDCFEVRAVRYAWVPFSRGNLINDAQLPASTFVINLKSQQ